MNYQLTADMNGLVTVWANSAYSTYTLYLFE